MTDTAELKELPAVAKNIHLACKKCGVDRFHVVVAHTTATSAKVKCEVCGASKTFKLESAKAKKSSTSVGGVKEKKAPKAPGTGKKAEAERAAYSELYNKLKSDIGLGKIINYTMKAKFDIAHAIKHPNFGIGFVTRSTIDRIEVAFESGGKSLVHNRP
jgi:transcription elongation factor Elf1